MIVSDVYGLAIALGLGLLIGFQREWAEEHAPGIRTFPLITSLGALSALLAQDFGPLPLAAGFLGVGAILSINHYFRALDVKHNAGITTDVAALVMFVVGAILIAGHVAAAVAMTGVVAVLLQWKRPLHDFVRQLDEPDIRAIIRVVLIALVVLPLLPNEDYGPYNVLNPFEIWLMVALIVGISLVAYLTYKLLGAKVGTLLGGLLGGLISSTATTVGYARASRDAPARVPMAAAVIMLASTFSFGRVLFEIALVAPDIVAQTAPPLIAMMGIKGLIAAAAFLGTSGSDEPQREQKPPSDLLAAVIFGALYAAVLMGVAFAREQMGDRGLYLVAVLSGLTDMDAITLSTAQMVKSGGVDPSTGWRVILVGSMANLVFKGAAVAVLGNARLFFRVALMFTASAAFGVALMLFWPW